MRKFIIEPKECSDQGNYVTKMFSVSAGDVVSLTPIVGQIGIPQEAVFCHTLPVLKQTTGTISGRTFSKSLYAELTPFILALEG
jgi:hypothetical protein